MNKTFSGIRNKSQEKSNKTQEKSNKTQEKSDKTQEKSNKTQENCNIYLHEMLYYMYYAGLLVIKCTRNFNPHAQLEASL